MCSESSSAHSLNFNGAPHLAQPHACMMSPPAHSHSSLYGVREHKVTDSKMAALLSLHHQDRAKPTVMWPYSECSWKSSKYHFNAGH